MMSAALCKIIKPSIFQQQFKIITLPAKVIYIIGTDSVICYQYSTKVSELAQYTVDANSAGKAITKHKCLPLQLPGVPLVSELTGFLDMV